MIKTKKDELDLAIKILKSEREKHSKFITVIDTQIVGLREEIRKIEEDEHKEKNNYIFNEEM